MAMTIPGFLREQGYNESEFPSKFLDNFAAAVRAEALEEAAKVAENWKQDTGGQDVYLWPPTHIAAAIRALIGPQNEKSAP
jgi:hypothetical protein